jgi:hypothetical protein
MGLEEPAYEGFSEGAYIIHSMKNVPSATSLTFPETKISSILS